MRYKEKRKIANVTIRVIIAGIILIGTLDLIYGNGLLGLILYGVVIMSIIGGFTYGLNISTGLGIVSRHKRDNFPQSRGKPSFTFTIDKNPKEIRDGMETGIDENRIRLETLKRE